MNDLILTKMREGDWGAVVRLMREEREGAAVGEQPKAEPGRPMPFKERFETVRITPQKVADSVVEENGRFKALSVEGEEYKPSQRFLKGMAQRMKVPLSVFELFTPLEVIRRAAERVPDLQLRLTVDREEKKALALIEDKGVPMPAGNIEIVMKEDKRLQDFSYHDGIITGRFDLGEAWDIPNDSKYGVWRQVCSNGAVAEAPLFRTKMEVKDNSGEHFRRLLRSFSNPRGVEMLHERLIAANGTKASVDEVYQAESFIRRQVRDARHQMLLCERLQEVADNPCVRYGVTDLGAIGERRRGLLPTGASVADTDSWGNTTREATIWRRCIRMRTRRANTICEASISARRRGDELGSQAVPAGGGRGMPRGVRGTRVRVRDARVACRLRQDLHGTRDDPCAAGTHGAQAQGRLGRAAPSSAPSGDGGQQGTPSGQHPPGVAFREDAAGSRFHRS